MMGFAGRYAVRRRQDNDVLTAEEAIDAWRLWLDGIGTADIAQLLVVNEAAVYNEIAARRSAMRRAA